MDEYRIVERYTGCDIEKLYIRNEGFEIIKEWRVLENSPRYGSFEAAKAALDKIKKQKTEKVLYTDEF